MADKTELLKSMLAMLDNPGEVVEKATSTSLMDANGELPVKSVPSVQLPKAQKSTYATLKTLRARHYKMIAMHIAGSSNNEIAAAVQVSTVTVTKTLKSPMAQDLIAQAMGVQLEEAIDLKDKLDEIAGIGVSRLEDIIINDPDNKTALSAIKTVLEYVQSKAVTKTENVSMTVTPADIVAMRKRAAEIQPAHMIPETPYEDISGGD